MCVCVCVCVCVCEHKEACLLKVKSSGMSVCMLKANCQLPITSNCFFNFINMDSFKHICHVSQTIFSLYMAPKKLPCKTLHVHNAK